MSSPSPATPAAVFLSYAREDAEAARRIADALRAFGVEVWFDQHELRGGDQWDQKIRSQIKGCALFVPIVSATTEARPEGYFRREWKLAAERTADMGRRAVFLVPVVVDGTPESSADVPEEFLRVQWTRLPNGVPSPQFVEQVKRLLEPPRVSAGLRPSPADVPADPVLSGSTSPVSGIWRKLPLVVAIAVIVAIGFGVAWWTRRPPADSAHRGVAEVTAVAVVPFANLSGDPSQEYFSDGLTEEILNALAREPDLRVPGRASAFSFKNKSTPATEIARALNVTRIVEGSVRRERNRVRITIQLTRASDGFTEQLGSFTEEFTDVWALQDKVAREVVRKLTNRAATVGKVVLTKNTEAYEAYLRGRALQLRASRDAAKEYERAVAIDPAFALAWTRLAETRFRPFWSGYDTSPGLIDSTKDAIDRALAIQPDLPDALIMRAHWVSEAKGDFAAAKSDLEHADSLQPPTAELRFAQAILAFDLGDVAEGIRLGRECLSLDPQNGDYTNAVGIRHSRMGDFVEADRLYSRAMMIQGPSGAAPFSNRIFVRLRWRGPEAALRLLERASPEQASLEQTRAEVLCYLGRMPEATVLAEAVLRKKDDEPGIVQWAASRSFGLLDLLTPNSRQDLAQRLHEGAVEEFRRGNRAPRVRFMSALAEIVLGNRAEALRQMKEWHQDMRSLPRSRRVDYFSRFAARPYGMLGMADEAVDCLVDELGKGRQPGFALRYDPAYASIRTHPRFVALMHDAEAWARAQPDPVDP